MSNKTQTPIESVEVTGLSYYILQRIAEEGYDTLEKVAAADEAKLMKFRGFGKATLAKLKLAAEAKGIPWTGKPYRQTTFGPILKLDYNSGHMNLRDWFAGQALAGLLASDWSEEAGDVVSCLAYEHADCMLAQRANGGAK